MRVASTVSFLLRMPSELAMRVRQRAASTSVSVNRCVLSLIESGLQDAVRDGGEYEAVFAHLRAQFGSGLIGVVLFGSAARAQAWQGSDVDLLVVLDESVTLSRDLYRTWDANQQIPRRFSPHFVHLPQESFAVPSSSLSTPSSLWLEVATDGIVLSSRSDRLARALSKLRARIAAGEFRRQFYHGQPAWSVQL